MIWKCKIGPPRSFISEKQGRLQGQAGISLLENMPKFKAVPSIGAGGQLPAQRS